MRSWKRQVRVMDYHKPVLLNEVLENLSVKKGGWYLDCTLGDGGHSLGILEKGGNIVGIDQDSEAVERVEYRFKNQESRIKGKYRILKGNFREIKELVEKVGIVTFEGIIFDLGVSSFQLDKGERGFSFSKEARLDMRMDQGLQVSAFELLNGLTKEELVKLFEKYGEFRDRRVVWEIARRRREKPIVTTKELSAIVEEVVGGKKPGKIHPATTIFQALRMAVNDEMNSLKEGLAQSIDLVCRNGLILVISFHSGEERIVGETFKNWSNQGKGEIVTKQLIRPSLEEIIDNPRARSAKLSVFRKSGIC